MRAKGRSPRSCGSWCPLADRSAALWASFPVFADLDPAARAALAARSTRRRWAAGQALFRKGDAGDFMVGLLDGRVRLSILSPAGRELLIRTAEPGDLLGEIACLDGGPRSTDATAATAVEALVLTAADWRRTAAAHPGLHDAAIRHLGTLLRATNDRLEAVTLHQLEARLARLLLFRLDALHGAGQAGLLPLPPGLSQGDIALMLGASRPRVNRTLQLFRDRGAILARGPDLVCDPAILARIAAGEDEGPGD